jgi:cytochrome P450
MTFILAMMTHPAIQQRAQAELDKALGSSGVTFPTFEMRNQLPYLEAVVKETLRWCPVFSLGQSWITMALDKPIRTSMSGIPRSSASDDFYNGK